MRIPKGYQRNKISLVLDNSEIDYFEKFIKNMSICNLRTYILEQINKARLKNE